MMYIQEVIHNRYAEYAHEYFSQIPAIATMDRLAFTQPVTLFTGENGSGKSTLLEAIAVAFGFNAEGGSKNFTFSTRESHSNLYDDIRLKKNIIKPRDGFFLRAESFYNLSSNIDDLDRGGRGRQIIESYGGQSLHTLSHGESFLHLVLYRFGGNGLYLLDEPEAALSPTGQFTLLSKLHELVKNRNSQFIIATHSPILLSYPDALIYEFENDRIKEKKYQDTENYILYHRFLNDPSFVERIVSKREDEI